VKGLPWEGGPVKDGLIRIPRYRGAQRNSLVCPRKVDGWRGDDSACCKVGEGHGEKTTHRRISTVNSKRYKREEEK